MSEETLKELCVNVKRKCKITWDDTDTDARVESIVKDAEEAMYHKLGIRKDTSPSVFLEPGLAKTLFETYCLYDWNNMLGEFEKNYKSEILTERHRYEVEYGKADNQ